MGEDLETGTSYYVSAELWLGKTKSECSDLLVYEVLESGAGSSSGSGGTTSSSGNGSGGFIGGTDGGQHGFWHRWW